MCFVYIYLGYQLCIFYNLKCLQNWLKVNCKKSKDLENIDDISDMLLCVIENWIKANSSRNMFKKRSNDGEPRKTFRKRF